MNFVPDKLKNWPQPIFLPTVKFNGIFNVWSITYRGPIKNMKCLLYLLKPLDILFNSQASWSQYSWFKEIYKLARVLYYSKSEIKMEIVESVTELHYNLLYHHKIKPNKKIFVVKPSIFLWYPHMTFSHLKFDLGESFQNWNVVYILLKLGGNRWFWNRFVVPFTFIPPLQKKWFIT